MWKVAVFVACLGILTKLIYDKMLTVEDHLKSESIGKTSEDVAKIFSRDELLETKTKANLLYLAILGKVYDVGTGAKHYQKGGSYEFFVGNS